MYYCYITSITETNVREIAIFTMSLHNDNEDAQSSNQLSFTDY